MEENKFRFCPECGGKNIQTLGGGRKWLCPDCNFELYNNVASSVGLLIFNDKGEILLEKRAKDPEKGKLVPPGGFTDPDETGEHAAIRECLEETGVEPVSLKYLCSFPNVYPYKNFVYKTCDMYYHAELPSGFVLKPQESEVESFVWKSVKTVQEVDELPIAFDSGRRAIKLWVEKNLSRN